VARRLAAIAVALAPLALASALRADDLPQEAVIAAIPFEANHEPNRIFLNLAPDSSPPFRLLLDTGAAFSVMTPGTARKLGIAVESLKDSPYRRATRLGTDLQFLVDTRGRSDTGSKTGWEYGLLGGNFLRQFVVDVDFEGRQTRFADANKYAIPQTTAEPETSVVPIRVGGNRPVVEIRVGGRPIQVLIDTGCQVPLVLSGAAAKQVGIDVDSLAEFGDVGTVLGPMHLRLLESVDVEIGGLAFSAVPAVVAPHGWYNMGAEANDSVIGYDLISRFHARLDYPHSRVWLHREKPTVPFFGVDYAATRASGALVYPNGENRFQVIRVLPETPAARLGLKLGDVLMTENPAGGIRTQEQVIQAVREGQRVRVARKINEAWVDLDLPDDPLLQQPAP